MKRPSDVGRDSAHIAPVAALGNLEPVVLRKLRILLIAARFVQSSLVLLVMHIRNPLEEEQREDVGLEVGSIDRTTEDVGRFPEVGFELANGDGRRVHGWQSGGPATGCRATPRLGTNDTRLFVAAANVHSTRRSWLPAWALCGRFPNRSCCHRRGPQGFGPAQVPRAVPQRGASAVCGGPAAGAMAYDGEDI